MSSSLILFWIVLLLASLAQVVSDIYLPSMPFIATSFHVSTHLVQLSLFYFMAGLAISQLIYGPASDAYGRKPPLLIGLSLCLIGSLLCLFASGIDGFNFGRLLQGLGAGVGLALSRAILRDLFSGPQLAKVGSYLSIANIAIMTSAPFIGGYLQAWISWRASFVALTLYTLFMMLLLLWKLPETNLHRDRRHFRWSSIQSSYIRLLKDRQFLPYACIIFMTYACVLAWLTTAPILLQHTYSISPTHFGWLCLLVGAVYASGSLSNAQLLNAFSPRSLLCAGLAILLLGTVLITAISLLPLPPFLLLFVAILIMLFGVSLIFPNAYACLMTPFAKQAGVTGALTSFLQTLGGVITSGLIACLPTHTARPMGYTVFVAALCACMAFYFAVREPTTTKKKSHSNH